jgi:hypothetical protein
MATRPIGPHSLYWACRIQGANAYRAAKVIAEYQDQLALSHRTQHTNIIEINDAYFRRATLVRRVIS